MCCSNTRFSLQTTINLLSPVSSGDFILSGSLSTEGARKADARNPHTHAPEQVRGFLPAQMACRPAIRPSRSALSLCCSVFCCVRLLCTEGEERGFPRFHACSSLSACGTSPNARPPTWGASRPRRREAGVGVFSAEFARSHSYCRRSDNC